MKIFLVIAMIGILSFILHLQKENILLSKNSSLILSQGNYYNTGVVANPFINLAGSLIKLKNRIVLNSPFNFNFGTSDNLIYFKSSAFSGPYYHGKIRFGYHSHKLNNIVIDNTYDDGPRNYNPNEDDIM